MSYELRFLVRQSYLRRSSSAVLPKTAQDAASKRVDLSKLSLRQSTFYSDDVVSRNSPNMISADNMTKEVHNYGTFK